MRALRGPLITIALLGASVVGIPRPPGAVLATTTGDLLAGFVVEEVEPGVLRVVDDGVRDLADQAGVLVAGLDGSIWLFGADRFYRLGEEGHAWDFGDRLDREDVGEPDGRVRSRLDVADIEVGPDGVVWATGLPSVRSGRSRPRDLRSFDGREWTVRLEAPRKGRVLGVEIGPDGTAWASIDGGRGRIRVSWLAGPSANAGDAAGWTDTGSSSSDGFGMWAVGEGFLVVAREPSGTFVYRHDGRDWAENGIEIDLLRPKSRGGPGPAGWVEVGPDGTVWAGAYPDPGDEAGVPRLARFDGTSWHETDDVDEALHAVAPDGALWAVPAGSSPGTCTGIARFDGTTWERHLEGYCVRDVEISPDGAAWLLAREAGPGGGWQGAGPDGIYVIGAGT